MRRRQFIAGLAGAAAWPVAARAQQRGKVWRIGVLDFTSAALNAVNTFRQGLREFGYVEGQNLIIEYRSTDGRAERPPEVAAEFVRLDVDLIVTRGTAAALAVKNASTTIPVVMAAIANPLAVVASLARPGGNVTGFSSFFSDLAKKRLELLREIIPGVARIAFLGDSNNPNPFDTSWDDTQAVAKLLGVEIHHFEGKTLQDIEHMFDVATGQRSDALIVPVNDLTLANRLTIVDLAAKHRLPAIYGSTEFIAAGGLLAYGVSYSDLYRRAATYVDRILKGEKPSDLPVQQPVKLELVVNLKTAKALGLTIPETLLATADEVIQ